MSGGLTSYPRTGGGGGSSGQQISRLISALLAPGTQSRQSEADQLIALLQQLDLKFMDPQSVVTLARRARDALFVARCNRTVLLARHLQAMEVCATAWKLAFPLGNTALNARAVKAQLQLSVHSAAAGTAAHLRAIKEEIGLIAWLYEASAMLGDDLAAGAAGLAQQLGTSRYVGTYDSGGKLSYLECAGSYNINVLVRINVPGASQDLLLVGEAKGGKSQYGTVQRTSAFRKMFGGGNGVISQKDLIYAASRALYMSKACLAFPPGMAPAHRLARQEAGDMILQAHSQLRLCYLTARGDAAAATSITTSKEIAQCL
ncbi:hypothetical protein QCD79_16215 [Pseudomonas quasicaspiana]|nr:hypothetical protein [Pseudomonas quasicaspiana]